ncbi:putative 2-keto-3-deoxy-galactonate aldolase YagE [Botrimarina colliarenosi]|uniref:Putative 2-keto-3-deoxy-galactonate aldolase YagE n=1 Tax=Botrimarina colliarenosi TaxID=2528001 RepID=A0A5C6AE54_9BACT|nr:dihydrodipicolinate synthase family protein [Botrimarina colliarenosi]TWT97700.1 putative 2-keto-3-deoxy-galactonate aldolase YagE [Botrimarina colliarenosi]
MSLPQNIPLRGIVPPLVTPLTPSEELDRPALERLIEKVLGAGVHGLFVLGTTGEGPSLSYEVRLAMVEAACQITAGRVPVLVGVTDTSLAESINLSRRVADAGADAVVFAPPCYFPIDQADLVTAVRRLAAESPLPVMLYNMPALTKIAIKPETLRALLDEPTLLGLKDSSGDLAYFRQARGVINERPDWTLLAGPEHLLAETISIGGDGGVCGGANVFPELFVQLFDAATGGVTDEVQRLQKQVERLGELYRLGSNPAVAVIQGVKAALAELGVCDARLVSPVAALDATNTEAVARIVRGVIDLQKAPVATSVSGSSFSS